MLWIVRFYNWGNKCVRESNCPFYSRLLLKSEGQRCPKTRGRLSSEETWQLLKSGVLRCPKTRWRTKPWGKSLKRQEDHPRPGQPRRAGFGGHVTLAMYCCEKNWSKKHDEHWMMKSVGHWINGEWFNFHFLGLALNWVGIKETSNDSENIGLYSGNNGVELKTRG